VKKKRDPLRRSDSSGPRPGQVIRGRSLRGEKVLAFEEARKNHTGRPQHREENSSIHREPRKKALEGGILPLKEPRRPKI